MSTTPERQTLERQTPESAVHDAALERTLAPVAWRGGDFSREFGAAALREARAIRRGLQAVSAALLLLVAAGGWWWNTAAKAPASGWELVGTGAAMVDGKSVKSLAPGQTLRVESGFLRFAPKQGLSLEVSEGSVLRIEGDVINLQTGSLLAEWQGQEDLHLVVDGMGATSRGPVVASFEVLEIGVRDVSVASGEIRLDGGTRISAQAMCQITEQGAGPVIAAFAAEPFHDMAHFVYANAQGKADGKRESVIGYLVQTARDEDQVTLWNMLPRLSEQEREALVRARNSAAGWTGSPAGT